MDYDALKTVLKRYDEGLTSLEEEKQLREYFLTQNDVPEEWKSYADYFRYTSIEKDITYPTSLLRFEPKRKNHWKWLSVAAGMALLLSIYLYTRIDQQQAAYVYINGQPVEDTEMAQKEALKALMKVSNKLNQGTEELKHLSKWNKTEQLKRKGTQK